MLEYVDNLGETLTVFHDLLHAHGLLVFSLPNASSAYRRVERLIFRVSRRPRYYRDVKHIETLPRTIDMMEPLGFAIEDYQFYADRKLISRVISPMVNAEFCNDLFVTVFRKT